jgi:hypothetical protein
VEGLGGKIEAHIVDTLCAFLGVTGEEVAVLMKKADFDWFSHGSYCDEEHPDKRNEFNETHSVKVSLIHTRLPGSNSRMKQTLVDFFAFSI